MKESLWLILFVCCAVAFVITVISLANYYSTEESDKLDKLTCDELKQFIIDEDIPSQHALNHWTVCTARGWR